jgi:hypothetical protein
MNDIYIDTQNPIFEVIQEINDSDKNTLQKEGPVQLSEAFKEGYTAKLAEENKHSNHNIRAHLGKIRVYNNSNN